MSRPGKTNKMTNKERVTKIVSEAQSQFEGAIIATQFEKAGETVFCVHIVQSEVPADRLMFFLLQLQNMELRATVVALPPIRRIVKNLRQSIVIKIHLP